MAKNDKPTNETLATPQAVVLPVQPAAAPKAPGIFDEVQRLEEASKRGSNASSELHTFGAWARVKGVTPEQIREAIKNGTLGVSGFTGDGPEMTEEEFHLAVNFQLKNTFGDVAPMRFHVPADVARGGGKVSAEELAASEDAAARAAAKSV